MKSFAITLCGLGFTSALATAAPRVIVSTASLVPESKVDVVFDKAMIASKALGTPAAGVEIVPAWPGSWRWKSPEIAEFLPAQPPVIGAKYEFRAAKGMKHADGSPVPAGKFGEAASEEFRAVAGNSPNRWNSDYNMSTGAWIVVFNDDVSPAGATSAISFQAPGTPAIAASVEAITMKEAGWYGRSNKPWSLRGKPDSALPGEEDTARNVLKISPSRPLPAAKGWQLVIGKGVPNAAKTATTTQPLPYGIGDIQPFEAKEIEAVTEVDEPRALRFTFNHPLPDDTGAALLEKNLVISPPPPNLKATVEGKTITVTGDFENADDYNVAVRGPLASAAGLPLVNSLNKTVRFDHVEPSLSLPSDQQGQYAKGGRTYAIHTVNLAKVNLRVKRLKGTDLVRVLQGYQNYTGVGHEHTEITPTAPLPWPLVAGDAIGAKEFSLDNGIDTSRVIELKWDDVLTEKTPVGALFVDVTGEPKEADFGEGPKRRSAQAIVQLTDIGLAWKFTQHEVLTYAFSCASGKPLPGVKITMFGDDAAELDSAATDAQGIAKLPRQDKARLLLAAKDADAYASLFDSAAATVGMWHFPIRYSYNTPPEKQRRVFFFTDRSVYRPGETVRLKGLVRELAGNEIRKSPPAKAELVLIDPAEKEVLREAVKISDKGSFDFTHKLAVGRVGDHQIRLEFPDDLALVAKAEQEENEGKKPALTWEEREALGEGARFELALHVEEFRRNAFEITQTAAKPETAAVKVDVDLAAKYYQGQPVAAGKVKYYSRVAEQNPYPDRFQEYLFGDHRVDDWRYWYHYFGYRDDEADEGHSSNLEGETELSPEGLAKIAVEIPKSDFPRMRTVEVASEVTDANHQTLTSRVETTVFPADLTIGISRQDQLVRAGDVMKLKFVAVDNAGEPYSKPVTFSATLTREVNSAVKTRTDEGETATRNDQREETVSTAQITLDPAASAKDGQPFDLAPKATGLHFLTVRGKDEAGREFATVIRFHVYGTDEFPWKYEDGLRVKLIADKKSYKAGDTAKVLVLSPIEGRAIVTVEREKVLRSFSVDLKMDKPVVEIPVTDADAPNAFVSVLVVKGAEESAREVKEPQLRLGYCELLVEPRQQALTVSIDAPEKSYRPGDPLTLSGSVKTADGKPAAGAEVTFYAEDEGTLAVMGYETPDPMAYFYKPRILSVFSGTSFESFISEDPENRDFFNKGFFVGGGGDLGKLDDPTRKNFDPCATWAASLSTDENGRFSHGFTLPDTLTRYRVIAVAHDGAACFGKTETAITAKKEIMLEAKSPRAANQGDVIRPQVLVQNASDTKGTWEVRLIAHDSGGVPVCRATEGMTATVNLAPGESKTVSFPVAVETTGTAMVAWKIAPVKVDKGELTPALIRSLSDAVRTTFPCAYPMPLIRDVDFLTLTATAPLDLRTKLDKTLLDGQGTIDLEFSRSRLTGAAGAADDLLHYPYGCVEQTTSSLLPWCSVNALRGVIPAFAKVSDEQVKRALQAGVNRLLSMQLADGSFAYWPGGKEKVEWATPYAGMGLVLAAKAGAAVPQTALDSLTQHLSASLRGMNDAADAWQMETHARALYTLALVGKPDVSYQNLLADRAAKLAPATRALLAAAITISAPDDAAARERAKKVLLAKSAQQPAADYWMRYSPDDAYALLAWIHIDPASPEVNKTLDRLFNRRSPGGSWRTTWMNGWTLHALAECARYESATGEPVTVKFKTSAGEETITLTKEQPLASRSLPVGKDAVFSVTTDKPAFLRTNVTAKPAIQPMRPVAKNGLAVDRVYQLVNGDGTMVPLDQPKPGDLVRVTLRVTLPKDDSRYLAIDDPLPAIFEAVNSDFSSQSAALGIRTSENNSWNVTHSELRDDRALFFLDHVWKAGTYTVSYLARCTIAGEATAPSAKVEMMYDPENNALSASRRFATE